MTLQAKAIWKISVYLFNRLKYAKLCLIKVFYSLSSISVESVHIKKRSLSTLRHQLLTLLVSLYQKNIYIHSQSTAPKYYQHQCTCNILSSDVSTKPISKGWDWKTSTPTPFNDAHPYKFKGHVFAEFWTKFNKLKAEYLEKHIAFFCSQFVYLTPTKLLICFWSCPSQIERLTEETISLYIFWGKWNTVRETIYRWSALWIFYMQKFGWSWKIFPSSSIFKMVWTKKNGSLYHFYSLPSCRC